MKTSKLQTRPIVALLSVLTFVAVVAISPHAFAQQNPAGQGQQNGIPLGSSYSNPQAVQTTPSSPQALPNPSGQGQQNGIPLGSSYGSNPVPAPATPDEITMGWSVGIAVIVAMSAVGVYTTTRHR